MSSKPLDRYLIPWKAIAKASFTKWIENWLRNRNFNPMFLRGSALNVRGFNSYIVCFDCKMKFTNAVNFIFCSIKFQSLTRGRYATLHKVSLWAAPSGRDCIKFVGLILHKVNEKRFALIVHQIDLSARNEMIILWVNWSKVYNDGESRKRGSLQNKILCRARQDSRSD
jgi:hypothetical protein